MDPRRPRTYDEIVARTVPDPDSSFRPTPEQLRDTAEGRTLATDDELLSDRIIAALRAAGFPGIYIEVERGRATLRGPVSDIDTLNRLEDIVRGLAGVAGVDNRMHVEASGA